MFYTAFIVIFVLTVATWDLLYRRIPNALTVTGICSGFLYHAFNHTFSSSLLGAAMGFVVGFILFYLAAIGAGDLKLLTALGAILGWKLWVPAMIATVLVAGLIGFAQAISKGKLFATMRNIGLLLAHMAKFGLSPHPELNVRNSALIRSPFGIAACFGVLVAVFR